MNAIKDLLIIMDSTDPGIKPLKGALEFYEALGHLCPERVSDD